ncbi:hypothetical protein [Roseofilum sp. Guam]|nr:hypothetical protein [Roseofilum sp. Guam]
MDAMTTQQAQQDLDGLIERAIASRSLCVMMKEIEMILCPLNQP